MNSTPQYSDFWNTRQSFDIDEFLGTADVKEKKGKDLIGLSGYQRAIGNFVNIVTGQNIPVKFATRGYSYTDGKSVVISSSINEKTFDIAVGLALHEGSHIKLTDFEAFKQLAHGDDLDNDTLAAFNDKGHSDSVVYETLKNLTNWVEDRRIDRFIFDTSPGYKGYYHAMYDKYFHSKVIDKALLSTEYRTEDLESYMMRIINLTNSNRQLLALKGLKEIWEIVDLKNISRLKSTQDAIAVAQKILLVILSNIEAKPKPEETPGPGIPEDDSTGDESIDSNSSDDQSGNAAPGDSDSPATSSTNDDGTEASELSDRQKRMLKNALQKQEEFIGDKISKGKLSKADASTLNAIQQAGCSYKDVDMGNAIDRWGDKQPGKTKVIVVTNFTKTLVESNEFGILHSFQNSDNVNAVRDGIRLGSILGKKLKVRSEERSTKFTRKDAGKMDQRLIAELGFGNSNIFRQTYVDKYKDLNLHISIDASGSMYGDKWQKALTSAVAVIKAASMTSNINVQLTIRSTHSTGGSGRSGVLPLIVMAYDSRKDKISKVKSLFPHMSPGGTTPESLTFDAIMDQFVEGSSNNDSYFLNYSDGAPMFSNDDIYYSGDRAIKHTAKMVKKMNSKGIEVMSYFIEGRGYYSDSDTKDFRRMYGKAAQFINPVNMMDVARTLNKKFLQKV
jgi:hypothetical protein|tara:strand:+ start:2376 stop:4397 length:2022 start_codon:yes stop_codon:yes gene_type:complete